MLVCVRLWVSYACMCVYLCVCWRLTQIVWGKQEERRRERKKSIDGIYLRFPNPMILIYSHNIQSWERRQPSEKFVVSDRKAANFEAKRNNKNGQSYIHLAWLKTKSKKWRRFLLRMWLAQLQTILHGIRYIYKKEKSFFTTLSLIWVCARCGLCVREKPFFLSILVDCHKIVQIFSSCNPKALFPSIQSGIFPFDQFCRLHFIYSVLLFLWIT